MKPTIGVATISVPRIIPINVIGAAFVVGGWSGVMVCGDVEDCWGEVSGSVDSVEAGSGDV